MTDPVILRGGTVVDGTGAPGRTADVVIENGRIRAIGDDLTAGGAAAIDAAGKVVAPGFIDIKTHSDWTLPLMPLSESKIRQGVTTEVIGHCGYSCAPALPGKADALKQYLSPSAPWLDFVETSFADYVRTYPATSVNRVMLVGHNTLRLMTMGMEDRPPEPRRAGRKWRMLLEEALGAGALGMSSGLFTAPGSYAEERRAGRAGARAPAPRRPLLHPSSRRIQYGLRLGRRVDRVRRDRTGVHVQIVHIKLSGMDNWGGAERLLGRLEEGAAARSAAIDCDQYPYEAASNPLRNLCSRAGCRRAGSTPCSTASAAPMSAPASARRSRRKGLNKFRPDSIMGCRAHLDIARPAAIRRPHSRRHSGGAGDRPVRGGARLPGRRPRPDPGPRLLDLRGRHPDADRLAQRHGGVRRQRGRALRHHGAGEAAPSLLRPPSPAFSAAMSANWV